MAQIPVNSGGEEHSNLEPILSSDNLSVTSVTKKITKIFDDYPIDYCSSGDTFDVPNLHPSGKVKLF